VVSILVGDDFLLRSYSIEDAPALFKAVDAARAHLRPWLAWVDKTTRPEHSLQFIQQAIQQQHNQEGMALGIFHGQDLIGAIGMHAWDHEIKKAQIGYWLAPQYEGKGILSHCLDRFVDFLFQNVGLNKIEIHFIPANKRSASVATRLHCKVEGIIRQSAMHHGKLQDIVVAGLLKEEWVHRPQ